MVREVKVSNRARVLRYLIVSNDGLAGGLMSHAYFKKRLRDARLSEKVEIVLSGLMVSQGTRPDEIAKKILKKKGVPLNGCIVEPVTAGLFAEADVVLTLSKEDSNYVRNTVGCGPSAHALGPQDGSETGSFAASSPGLGRGSAAAAGFSQPSQRVLARGSKPRASGGGATPKGAVKNTELSRPLTYRNVPARVRTLDVPVILGASAENYQRAWAKIHAGVDEEIRRLASKN